MKEASGDPKLSELLKDMSDDAIDAMAEHKEDKEAGVFLAKAIQKLGPQLGYVDAGDMMLVDPDLMLAVANSTKLTKVMQELAEDPTNYAKWKDDAEVKEFMKMSEKSGKMFHEKLKEDSEMMRMVKASSKLSQMMMDIDSEHSDTATASLDYAE